MTAKKNELLLKQEIKSKCHQYTKQILISSGSGKKLYLTLWKLNYTPCLPLLF